MPRPDLVHYLQTYLKKFPLEDLRRQLAEEGVTEVEFELALQAAQKAPLKRDKHKAGVLMLVAAVLAIIAGGLFTISRKPAPAPAPAPDRELLGESAFLGRHGYVVRLPGDYVAVSAGQGSYKDAETVHFCRRGTDPTNFLNEGLYGQLGIVRLLVQPSPMAGSAGAVEAMARREEARLVQRGEKFVRKAVQVSSLQGVQFTVESPFPRVETYLLGQKVMYSFFAGQDDEVYREIVWSLRDAMSES